MKSLNQRIVLTLSGIFIIAYSTPVIASQAFLPFGNDLIVHTEERVYKYKPRLERWLTSPFDDGEIEQLSVSDSRLYLKLIGKPEIYYSDNGLLWQKNDRAYQAQTRLIESSTGLYVIESQYISLLSKTEQKVFSLEMIGPEVEKNNFYLTEPHLYYVKKAATNLIIFSIQENGVEPEITIQDCLEYEMVTDKYFGIHCANGDYWVKENSWKKYDQVIRVDTNDLGQFLLRDFGYDASLQLLGGEAVVIPNPIIDMTLFGDRFLLQDAERIWYDFDWKTKQEEPTGFTGMVTIANNKSMYWLIQEEKCSFSTIFGHLTSCNLSGNPNIVRYGGRFFSWYPTDSKIMISNNGENFSAQSTPWAVSARLREVFIFHDQLFVLLLNSTSKINLYRFDLGADSFRRITLPTQVTYSGNVGLARKLPEGEQIELEGYLGVLPGQVNQHYGYINDNSGGIQIYLKNFASSLRLPRFAKIRVVGEVGDTSAKRLGLTSINAVEDLGSIGEVEIARSPKSLDQLLGRLVSLTGKVVSREKTFFSLNSENIYFPVRGTDFLALVLPNDSVEIEGVADHNSASEKSEVFFIDLHSRVIEEEGSVSSVSEREKLSRQSPTAKPKLSQEKSAMASAPAIVRGVTLKSPTKIIPTPKDKAKEAVNYYLLLPLSLSAGYLCANGRRFRS